MKRLFISSISLVVSLSTLAQEVQPERDGEVFEAPSILGGDDFAVPSMPESLVINNTGGIEFDMGSGSIIYKDNVSIIADNGLELFANRARVDSKTQNIYLDGDVSIFQGPVLMRGKKAIFNYETQQIDTKQLRTAMPPLFIEADDFSSKVVDGKHLLEAKNAGITTHDYSTPNYWLRSDSTTIEDKERVTFEKMRLKSGDRQLFYLPYLSQPLDQALGYHVTPGAKTSWGLFLLNRYAIMLGGKTDPNTGKKTDQWLLSDWQLDLRTRRGVGLGVDLIDQRMKENKNLGWLKLYYLYDLDPNYERSSIPREGLDPNRGKVEFKYRFDLDENTDRKYYANFNLTYLSDEFFLEDFEPNTFQLDPAPDNTLGLFRQSERTLAGVYARVRPNEFYQSDTRLPELFVDQARAPIFNSGILHEGRTSLGVYREYPPEYKNQAPNPNLANLIIPEADYQRFYTHQELSKPLMVADTFAVTPRLGGGYRQYWDIDNTGENQGSAHFAAAMDLSMKVSKVYDVDRHDWGIDSLMHIMQPYSTFSFVAAEEIQSNFTKVDRLNASTRPRPLDVGRYSAIDDLQDWSILRLGLRNTLLTKRDGSSHEWLTLDTYIDAYFDDPEFDRNLSNLYNDLRFQPLPWMYLNLETQFPLSQDEADFNELTMSTTFMPQDDLEFTVSYRHLDSHPVLQNSDRLDVRGYARLSETWGVSFYQSWEFDDSTLEYQLYSLHKDMSSWTASIGLMMRDNRAEQDEYGFLINFSLKALPSISLPLTLDVNQ